MKKKFVPTAAARALLMAARGIGSVTPMTKAKGRASVNCRVTGAAEIKGNHDA